MEQNDVEKVEQVVLEAEKMLDKQAVDKQDIAKIADSIDTLLAEMGTFRRFFKRLG